LKLDLTNGGRMAKIKKAKVAKKVAKKASKKK